MNANIGMCLQRQERYDEAMTQYEHARRVLQRIMGKAHPSALTVMNNIATCMKDSGDLDGALAMQKDVLRLRENDSGDDTVDAGHTFINMAIIADEKGETQEAARLANRAHAIFVNTVGASHSFSRGAADFVGRMNEKEN